MQSSGQLSFTFSEPLNILTCKAYIGIYSIENDEATLIYAYGMHFHEAGDDASTAYFLGIVSGFVDDKEINAILDGIGVKEGK